MWRSIAAVVFGYVITGVLIVITDQIFELTIPGFKQMAMPPDFYFAVSIVTDALYSAAGGWLCAAIAKRRVGGHVLALIILGELAGVASTVALWQKVPHYFSFALLAIYPPAVWVGSQLRKANPDAAFSSSR
jgi:hypothetical protein